MADKVKPRGKKSGRALAKPYEPTKREAEVLAAYERSVCSKIPAPGMKVSMLDEDGQRVARLEVDHADPEIGYRLLSEAVGSENRDFLIGTVDSLAMAAQTGASVDATKLNYALSIVRGLHPNDQIEAMLGVQMAAIQLATMRAAERLGGSKSMEIWDMHERALNRLARTFAAQVEALKRYRSKGEQRVIVERVTVNEGGKAVVGNVAHGVG
ncbi:MAG TPA: hypothetical protein VGX71_26740 [Pseudaminobacter sp.]|nr:hypothetical protein [Pseudaminobacter sp.]